MDTTAPSSSSTTTTSPSSSTPTQDQKNKKLTPDQTSTTGTNASGTKPSPLVRTPTEFLPYQEQQLRAHDRYLSEINYPKGNMILFIRSFFIMNAPGLNLYWLFQLITRPTSKKN